MSDDVLTRLRADLSDRYAVERELGSGGMATVYLARDLKHEVAELGVSVRQIELSLFVYHRKMQEGRRYGRSRMRIRYPCWTEP